MTKLTTVNKKKKKERFIFVGLAMFILFFGASQNQTNAQSSVSPDIAVKPARIEIELEPGTKDNYIITITNNNDFAIPMNGIIKQFDAENKTGKLIYEGQSINFELDAGKNLNYKIEAEQNSKAFDSLQWLKLDTPFFIIEPKQKQNINLEINIPKNAEKFGYYNMIIFQAHFPSFYFEKESSKIIPAIGIPLLLRVGNEADFFKNPDLDVINFSLKNNGGEISLNDKISFLGKNAKAKSDLFSGVDLKLTKKFPIVFNIEILNNDKYHIKPRGYIYVYNIFNKQVAKIPFIGRTILPQKTRSFDVIFTPDAKFNFLPQTINNQASSLLFFGKFKAVLEIENEKNSASLDFWIINQTTLIIFLIMLFALIIFAKNYQKRIKPAIKIILKRN